MLREELDASARFVAEAGDAQIILDPPSVKVIEISEGSCERGGQTGASV